MRATVEQEVCIGCGLCAETCPRVFMMRDDIAVVQTDPVPVEVEAQCQQAADDCPVSAITLTDS